MGGPIPDFGYRRLMDGTDPGTLFIENLLQQIKDVTGIDLFWMLDWSWTTNTIMDLVRQANDLMSWLQNPVQRPPNLLTRPGFSSPSAIAEAPDWSWDAVVSLGTVAGPNGLPRTDPQGSARTTADGSRHALMSNAISDPSAVSAGQILTCQINVLVEDGFTAADDQAIRLELVPSLKGVLQDAVVLAHCGVPTGDPGDWIAAPADAKAVFFDVDYQVPKTGDIPDTVELRLVVSESAGGDVPVRFDGARVAAAGGFLVVLADLFDAGRQYLTDMWTAIETWVGSIFDQSAWTALKTDTDAAWALFVKRVKRALRHADADSYVPPSTSGIISDALKQNPWFGWLFQLVDDWLEPILKIGKACADFGDACWQAVTVFVGNVTAPNAWQTMVSSIETAWDLFIRRVFVSWGSTEAEADTKANAMPNPSTATTAALKNNAWFGWFFDMVDDWLQPVLNIGKAVTDFGDSCWKAITTFAADPGASGAWTTMTGAINSAWNTMVDAVLAAWGSDKTHADFASPATATEAALKNNPVTGWLWGNNFGGGNWLNTAIHSITDPIDNFFDDVRKFINQMIEGLHWGYFDENWVWRQSLTTPNSDKPGGTPVMTPGKNDDDGGGLAPSADASIPPAPTGLAAVPWWDLTVSGFPAGTLTYAISAVKGGIEGPAATVKAFAGTLVPPNTNGHVDLGWNAVSGADSYRIYRKVDGTYQSQDWRLIASPTTAYSWLTPYQDKTPRSGGTVAHPKTDAELAAQIVTAVKSTATTAQSAATTAQSTATAAQSTATAAQTTANTANSTASAASTMAAAAQSDASDALSGVSDAQQTAADANNAAILAAAKYEALPEANIFINNVDHESEELGVTIATSASGTTWAAEDGTGGQAPNSVSWTQAVPSGAKLLLVAISQAYTEVNSGNRLPVLHFNDVNFPDKPPQAGFDGLGYYSPYGGLDRIVWVIPIGANFIASSVTITAEWVPGQTIALVDATSLVIDGTTSGDYDVVQRPSGDRAIPANSLLVQMSTNAGSASVPVPGAWTGFTSERSVDSLVSQQTSRIYGLSSQVASRDIDAAISVSMSSSDSTLIIIKSTLSAGGKVGSFGKMVTATTSTPPTNALSGQVLPLNGYYQDSAHTPDLTVDLSAASFQVTYTGTYLVEFTVGCDANTGFVPVVLVNGAPESYGGNGAPNATGATYPTGFPLLAHSCLVYLNKGDKVSFGVYASSGTPVLSRAASIPKRAAISLVNRSYL